jgi:hypothetical protein
MSPFIAAMLLGNTQHSIMCMPQQLPGSSWLMLAHAHASWQGKSEVLHPGDKWRTIFDILVS